MKITVRTLDSNNHNFEFDDENITVKEFKELIFPDVNIPVDKQRIIFKGKILQDDKKIKEYGVDGCVVHLVQRAPPSTSASQESSTTAATPPTSSSSAPGPVPLNNSFGGSFPVAQQFVDNLISQFGAGNVSMNASGNSLNVNINVSPSNSTEDVRRRLQVARRFLCHADHLLRHMQPNHSHGGNCSHTQNTKESNHRAEREHSGDTSGVHQSESNSNQPTIDNDKSSSASNGVNPMDEIRNDNNVSMEDVVPNENNNLNTPPSQSNATQDQNIVRPQVLSHFLGDFMHFFHHFAPLLQRYRFLLHNPQGPERQATDDLLPDQMAEIFHDLSHAFHAISDLTFNFNSPTPQSLSCFPQMSPIRFQQATPHMRMMPVPRNSVGNSALRQGGPVAVAAISTTVVHIPASSVQRFVSGGETLTTPSATQGPINQNFPSSDQWHISGPAGVPIGGLPSGGNTGIPAGVMFGPFSMNIPQPTSVITGTAPNVSNTPRPRGGNASDVNMQDVLQNVMSALFPPVLNSTASGNPQSSSIQGHVNETSTPSATNDNSQRIHQRPQTSAQNLSQEISNQPHHHNQDSAVLHHDLLLPCHSFHLGPNFHSSNNNPQTTPQVVEVASVVIDHTSNLAAPTVNQTSSGQQTTVVPDTNSATTGGADMSSISNILNSMFGSLSSTNNPFSENDSSSFEDETSMDVEMDRDVSHQLMDLVTVLNENSNGAESSTRNPTLRSIFETRFQRPQNEEGANFFTELYDIFGETFTIPDLVAIMSGSTTPWARIQAPLRKLLEKHFNSNERITEAEIPNIAKKMAESLAGNDCMEITVRPDVDLAATLKNLEVDYFKKFLRLLISAESDYCNGIHSWFVEYAAWFFAVLDYSVTGGTESYITAYLSTESMEDALSEFSPAIRQFSTETLIRRTRASISGQAISPVALDAVIIRPGVKTMIQRENPCREGDSGRAAKRVRKNESVDVEKIWEEMNDGSTPSSESDPEVDSPPSPEDWHSQFPNDWVNVITRDVERQRKLPPQRPYSDAYLNGLSSKRRALMTRHGVEADRIDLKTSLKKAIEKVGVETDLKKLDDDIESTNLQGMFESAFKSDVRQRLQSDEDYRSKQHPNTEKYFIKKGKK